jgi:hypothetical protein
MGYTHPSTHPSPSQTRSMIYTDPTSQWHTSDTTNHGNPSTALPHLFRPSSIRCTCTRDTASIFRRCWKAAKSCLTCPLPRHFPLRSGSQHRCWCACRPSKSDNIGTPLRNSLFRNEGTRLVWDNVVQDQRNNPQGRRHISRRRRKHSVSPCSRECIRGNRLPTRSRPSGKDRDRPSNFHCTFATHSHGQNQCRTCMGQVFVGATARPSLRPTARCGTACPVPLCLALGGRCTHDTTARDYRHRRTKNCTTDTVRSETHLVILRSLGTCNILNIEHRYTV